MNTNLERRRFYLSKESLKYLDDLAVVNNSTPSILLDSIILELIKRKK